MHGTFVWADLATPDAAAATAFYTALFGWAATEPAEDLGGYQNLSHEGRLVAGLSPLGGPLWMAHLGVASADEAAERVAALGGKVLYEPMDVADLGRLALCEDPGQAPFGVWESGRHRGAEKVGAPVSLAWCERLGPGREEAVAFYCALTGWEAAGELIGDEDYTVFYAGRPVAGAGDSNRDPHWLVWFAVADTDAVAARATELGATVEGGPEDVAGIGRTAVLADPHGARFGILRGETADE